MKNLRLVGRLDEGLFRTGALSQVIKASDRLWKKVKFRKIFWGKFAKKLANFARNFAANFAEKQWVKNSQFHCNFLANFTKIIDLTSAVPVSYTHLTLPTSDLV